jgi:hypothetical protein
MAESSNVPKITIRNRDRSVTIVCSFAVEGAPDMPAQYSGKAFRPDFITIKLQDWRFHGVSVTGPRVLAGDRLGQARARKHWYTERDLNADAPAWVKDALDHVRMSEGVTR